MSKYEIHVAIVDAETGEPVGRTKLLASASTKTIAIQVEGFIATMWRQVQDVARVIQRMED